MSIDNSYDNPYKDMNDVPITQNNKGTYDNMEGGSPLDYYWVDPKKIVDTTTYKLPLTVLGITDDTSPMFVAVRKTSSTFNNIIIPDNINWVNFSRTQKWPLWRGDKSLSYKDMNFNFNSNANLPRKSNIKFINNIDLFPFKIVNLGFLIQLGKVKYAKSTDKYYDYGFDFNSNQSYDIARVTFNNDDDYLPLGDILVPRKDLSTDIYNIPVVLIKNDSKYCTPIRKDQWRSVGDRHWCNEKSEGGQENYYYVNNAENYNDDYIALGCAAVNYLETREWGYSDRLDRLGCIVAVNKKYLSRVSDCFTSTTVTGSTHCYYHTSPNDISIAYSNPFFNFKTCFYGPAYDGFTNIIKKDDVGNSFYDIVPEVLIAKCCSTANLPSDIDRNKGCGLFSDPGTSSSGKCYETILDIVNSKPKNLIKDDFITYFKNQDPNFIDQVLPKFCQDPANNAESKMNNVTDPEYTSYTNACSCFMTEDFYKRWRQGVVNDFPNDLKTAVTNLDYLSGGFDPKCGYPKCHVLGSVKPYGSNPSPVCHQNVQFCINTAKTDIGVQQGSDATYNQLNNCLQQVYGSSVISGGSTSIPSTPSTPSTPSVPSFPPTPSTPSVPSASSKKSSTSFFEEHKTAVYVGIGVFVIIIIAMIILVIYLNSGNSDDYGDGQDQGYSDEGGIQGYSYYSMGKTKRKTQ